MRNRTAAEPWANHQHFRSRCKIERLSLETARCMASHRGVLTASPNRRALAYTPRPPENCRNDHIRRCSKETVRSSHSQENAECLGNRLCPCVNP